MAPSLAPALARLLLFAAMFFIRSAGGMRRLVQFTREAQSNISLKQNQSLSQPVPYLAPAVPASLFQESLNVSREERVDGAPISVGEVAFGPGDERKGVDIHIAGFCWDTLDATNRTPVCTSEPCCCWSTFAAPRHPAYPNPMDLVAHQHCYNPPNGYAYAPEPGFTYASGTYQALSTNYLPAMTGRRLCCLMSESNPMFRSQVAITSDEDHPPTTTEPPPTTVAAAFTTTTRASTTATTTTTTTEYADHDDYETEQMEVSAQKYGKAAGELKESAAALNSTLDGLSTAERLIRESPVLQAKKRHIERMKQAIHTWAYKRWENINALKEKEPKAMLR